jgi:Tfp pilus assembly protein PilO
VNARARLIVTIVAAIMVNLLFFVLFVRGRQSELSSVKEEITAEENRTQQLQADLTRLEGLQDQAPEFEARLLEIRRLVPERVDVGNLIFQMQEAADQAGIDFVQIAPELPSVAPEDGSLAQVRVTITGIGSYFSLQDFIRRLYDLNRALRIDVLTMASQTEEEGRGTTEINLNVTARVFFERPPGGTAPTGAPAPAPEPPVETEESPAPEETEAP